MNEELRKNADASYRLAEEKAAQYFQSLYMQVNQKAFIPTLLKDLKFWKRNHIHRSSVLSFFSSESKKMDRQGYTLYPMAELYRQARQ
jgi:hypothetical protein